jgi:hypothetical protein
MGCCRARRPDLGPSFFFLLLKTDLQTDVFVASTLLKCLCYAILADNAVEVLLQRMSELGCVLQYKPMDWYRMLLLIV